ncbi:MAG: hypothetical protein AABY27_03910 [Pseudomonadota bacterium]
MLLILWSSLAVSIEIPSEFLYQDKLIDPNCILESNLTPYTDLKECSKHLNLKITNYIIQNDMIGYKYLDTANNNYPSSIIYKYLGKIKDSHVVYGEMLGAQRLSFINYYQIIKENTLRLIKKDAAGDRSFGGIYNAKIENQSLFYEMSLTPKLFILNFSENQETNPILEELGDCAVCQFARVKIKDNKAQSIILNHEIGKYQSNSVEQCFNNIHNDYIKKHYLEITADEAKELVKSFLLNCK